jgi:hypothetical protein
MKFTHKPKTEKFIKEVSDAFLPLQIVLNRFPENIAFFERQSNHNFEIRYDKELKEYRLSINFDFVEAHLGESDLSEEQLNTGLY